jgi:hypothetical protein
MKLALGTGTCLQGINSICWLDPHWDTQSALSGSPVNSHIDATKQLAEIRWMQGTKHVCCVLLAPTPGGFSDTSTKVVMQAGLKVANGRRTFVPQGNNWRRGRRKEELDRRV